MADMISSNEFLLTEILIRIPVRSLLKLRRVCKHWRCLISSPIFTHLHSRLRRPRISGMILYRWSRSEFEFFSIEDDEYSRNRKPHPVLLTHPTNNPGGQIRIIQSCNGLLLCSCSASAYFVLNPTTGNSSPIPNPPGRNPNKNTLCLVFDTADESPDHNSNYSIISVSDSGSSITIYERKSQRWRTAGDEFQAPFDMVFSGGVFWSRSVHWISPSGAALRFDIDEERMKPMPAAPTGFEERRFRLFQESGGHLFLVDVYGACASELMVMEMEGDYSAWFVKYRVDLGGLTASYPAIVRSRVDSCEGKYLEYHVMCVCCGEEGESKLVVRVPGKIVGYGFVDGKIREIGDWDGRLDWVDVHPFVESLVCP